MCIGIPMRVEQVFEHFIWAREYEAAECRKVETALINPVQVGDWVLVFINSARETITPERAHEIIQTQALIKSFMLGRPLLDEQVDFALPSEMTQQEIEKIVGLKK